MQRGSPQTKPKPHDWQLLHPPRLWGREALPPFDRNNFLINQPASQAARLPPGWSERASPVFSPLTSSLTGRTPRGSGQIKRGFPSPLGFLSLSLSLARLLSLFLNLPPSLVPGSHLCIPCSLKQQDPEESYLIKE